VYYNHTIIMEIEEDNRQQLVRFKQNPPHPSYIGGFIDGDGCIFIRKITDGYQSGITITQCRTNILHIIRYHFGGSITSSANRNNKIENIMDKENEYIYKYNKRNQYNLIIRSNEYQILLEYIRDFIIIKTEQIESLYEMNKIINLPNKITEKEELYKRCMENNIKTSMNVENCNKINIEYISGLFDAEGCLFIRRDLKNCEISISQKNHPHILQEIQKFLGFGKVYKYRCEIFKKNDCLTFIRMVKPFIIVKYNQLEALEKFLNTQDTNIREEMYKICNEEKHNIEHFTDLNKNDIGKDGYLETMRLKKLKDKICHEIKIKQVYKEKSENMKGEKNHNYGKKKSEETKKKMSNSIRDVKNGVSDEIIIHVREMLKNGNKNVEIQKALNLPRHTITRIKNGDMVCRTEEKQEKTPMTNEEIGILKRKIHIDEILIVIDKVILGDKPSHILKLLTERRKQKNIENEITIDIVKNIKRTLNQHKLPFYEWEVSNETYNHYINIIEKNIIENKA